MLFNAKINEIQCQVSANSLEIEALLLRVEELRAQNLAMENHLQQLGSAENAAESAIEQIKTALMMINAISPTEVMTFKGADLGNNTDVHIARESSLPDSRAMRMARIKENYKDD